MRKFLFILLLLPFTLLSQGNYRTEAYDQIKELKNGIVLIRLHTDEAIVKEMKKRRQFNLLKAKLEEVEKRNKEIKMAFEAGYTFTPFYFFYGKDSDKIRAKDYTNVFIGNDLQIDASLKLDSSQVVYIIDVGDIYFEAFGGHFEGIVVMDDKLNPLKKPFPYYVKKRSGLAIIKRSDLDMVLLLQKEFDEFLKESANPRKH